MKRLICAGLVLAATGSMAQGTGEMPVDDRWYTGVMGGVASSADQRQVEGITPYFGAYFGRFLSHDFSLDLQLDAYRPEFDEQTVLANQVPGQAFDDKFELYGIGLAARLHGGDTGDKHRPYGLFGLGIQEHDNFSDSGRDIYASLGLGLRSEFSENLSMRTQFEGRYDNDRRTFQRDDGFVDWMVSIGLTYTFGERPRPPAPQPPPEPRAIAPPPEPAPPPPPPPAPEPEVLFDFDATVLFAFDSAQLRNEAERELEEAADMLAPRDEIILIEVAGHTDSMGPEDYNQQLSERRAAAVADYLAERGIDRDRMRVVGYGESRPRVPNDSVENRQLNRRVVLSVLERAD